MSLNIASKAAFSPTAKENLHMTAIFFGKTLIDVPRVFDIVSHYNLSGKFSFDRLEYFPPSKCNLIVAIFKSNDEISQKLGSIKNELSDELGYNLQPCEEFIPHVTLGKLKLTKTELDDIINSSFLADFENEIENRNDLMYVIDEYEPLYLCGGLQGS